MPIQQIQSVRQRQLFTETYSHHFCSILYIIYYSHISISFPKSTSIHHHHTITAIITTTKFHQLQSDRYPQPSTANCSPHFPSILYIIHYSQISITFPKSTSISHKPAITATIAISPIHQLQCARYPQPSTANCSPHFYCILYIIQ
jgi:hypothetical protein